MAKLGACITKLSPGKVHVLGLAGLDTIGSSVLSLLPRPEDAGGVPYLPRGEAQCPAWHKCATEAVFMQLC